MTLRPTHKQFIIYLLVGGFVVGVNLGVLYALTEFAHVFYLPSSIGAFCISLAVSFVLQKYLTFKDTSTVSMHKQAFFYGLMQMMNVLMNTLFLYIAVTYLHIWYIFAQVVISFVLAIIIFFVNKQYIFNNPTT